MSKAKSIVNAKPAKVQKLCTLWTHDDNFSRDEFVFNSDKFPELPTTAGTVLQIVHVNSGTAVRDFQTTIRSTNDSQGRATPEHNAPDVGSDVHSKRARRGSNTITIDENGSNLPGGRETDAEKAFVFVTKPMPADLKTKHPNLQVRLTHRVS